jgi:hypothetical protein
MKLLILILLVAASISNKVNAEELGKSCPDLPVAGISSKDTLVTFFHSLKSAASLKTSAAFAKLVHYPLRVNAGKKKRLIKNEAELKKGFATIFTSQILSALESQKFEELFCRDQGVMIGNGEAWINEQDGKIGIYTINL